MDVHAPETMEEFYKRNEFAIQSAVKDTEAEGILVIIYFMQYKFKLYENYGFVLTQENKPKNIILLPISGNKTKRR